MLIAARSSQDFAAVYARSPAHARNVLPPSPHPAAATLVRFLRPFDRSQPHTVFPSLSPSSSSLRHCSATRHRIGRVAHGPSPTPWRCPVHRAGRAGGGHRAKRTNRYELCRNSDFVGPARSSHWNMEPQMDEGDLDTGARQDIETLIERLKPEDRQSISAMAESDLILLHHGGHGYAISSVRTSSLIS